MATNSNSSLPGLTPQVGFTRLAADNTAQLGQARVAVQSINLCKELLRSRWMRGSSPRMTAIEGRRRYFQVAGKTVKLASSKCVSRRRRATRHDHLHVQSLGSDLRAIPHQPVRGPGPGAG